MIDKKDIEDGNTQAIGLIKKVATRALDYAAYSDESKGAIKIKQDKEKISYVIDKKLELTLKGMKC